MYGGVLKSFLGLGLVFLQLYLASPANADECSIADDSRFDCFPQLGATEGKCEARGCCWRLPMNKEVRPAGSNKTGLTNLATPYCFFPSNFAGYKVTGSKETVTGFQLSLELAGRGGPYGNNYKEIVIDIALETQSRLHVTVSIKFCI